jgi:uncharacterized iron-regulated membrane protein
MFLIRWLHKWFGLVLGLQFLLWAISGTGMALLDHHKVMGEGATRPAEAVAAPAEPLALSAVAAAVGAPILQLQLKPLQGRYVYEATTPQGVRLVDAVDGREIRIDEARARAIAVNRFTGFAPVKSIDLVDEVTMETRKHPLPLWRVEFDDSERTTLLVSATTGELIAAKDNTWRLWDIFWMIHIMDYTERESFNHPLIITVATGVAWLALSGFILLFRSFRRSDVSWIVDPIEDWSARRKKAKARPASAAEGSAPPAE